MKINYQKGFSIVAIFMAIAAFLGFGTHAVNNMQATTTVNSANEVSSASDWKTYSNARYGFSFRYPNDWSVCSGDEATVVYVRVSIDCVAAQKNQADYFMVRNIGDLDLGNLKAGVLKSDTGWNAFTGNSQMRAVYFQSQNINLVSVAVNVQDKAVLNKISSTFNIASASYNSSNPSVGGGESSGDVLINTNPDSQFSTSWKTYANTKYAFTLRYPESWSVIDDKDSDLGGFHYISLGTLDNTKATRFAEIRIYPNQATLAGFLKYFDYLKGQPTDLIINGIVAKQISATNQDGTRVVLFAFIKNGYGYQISASEKNSVVVKNILQTINFNSTTN